MSLPDRNNPYNFDAFLEWRENVDYYADDPFLQKVAAYFAGDEFGKLDPGLREFSKKVSHRWRKLAEEAALPENRPFMMHYDGHRRRTDRIVRPMETRVMEREIFGEGLFSDKVPDWERLVKFYLLHQNSEACIACPMVCTEGLVAVLDRFADIPETRRILKHCKEGIDGDFAIGAQYLSEIQGGSDVPANLVEAVEEDGVWKLYGNKFFCSAAHADYAAVTAKPRGSEKVALFVMPSWEDKENEVRNGFTIDRIKWKMGTSELPTAEITLNGAVAYPVGPLERGLANVVGIVLTYSRLTVGLSGAAGMARGYREAEKYTEFREAFGVPISGFPMVKGQLARLERMWKRTTAGAFRIYDEFLRLPGGLRGGIDTDEPLDARKRRFALRELIMLQKITASWDAVDACRLAMSLLGGHGVMEDFSSLPRFYRDGAVNELWEGPRNVLLTQIHRDMGRVVQWYPVEDMVRDILEDADPGERDRLAAEAGELISHGHLFSPDEKTIEVCERWDDFCHDLFHAYQDAALSMVEAGS
ncbi:MAG: acyl-CoA dehydrogenase family protein [Desulfatibacillaceae bacterium]